ncbi:nitrilase family protein [Microbacterium kribbense]|uniref:Nitrilase family protein n=1 Tax=Microbacterium kribbense TaxID=433645 RepID=A0ABP7G831_9MICO
MREAVAGGASIIVLPELIAPGYMFRDRDELMAAAEPSDGPTAHDWCRLATEHQVMIIGGMAERAGDVVYNSALMVDEAGVRAVYRKAHLWNHEKTVGFHAGSEQPPVIDTPFGRIGMMICYDLEFPEWVRLVALDGADLLCAPANWPQYPRPDGERPGEVVRVQADAAVNRMFVAVADRTGLERGQDWVGGSVIVDPDGYPVTRLALGGPAVLTADLDLSKARNKSISEENDVLADRRPTLYSRIAQ